MASASAQLRIQILADLDRARRELADLEDRVADIEPAANKSSQALRGMNGATAALKGAALGAAAAFLSLKTAAMLGKIADDYGQLASRLQMVTASSSEYALVQQRIMQTADRTYKPLADQQELFIRSSSSMKELGYATTQTLDFLDSVSSSLTVNSASSESFKRAIDAVSKSMVSGKVSGNEWQAVMETMPTAIADIASYLGKTENEVKKLASEGKLSINIFADAMIAAQKKNAELAENMPTTMGDATTKLQNHISSYVGELNQSLGATNAVSSAISNLAGIFDTEFTADSIEVFSILSSVLNDVISHLGESISFIGEMISSINNAIMSFTGLGAAVDLFGDSAKTQLGEMDISLKNIPANIKAFIQIAVVEIANFIEQARARVVSLANAIAALPKGIEAVKAAYAQGTQEIAQLEDARKASIQAILDERQAVLDKAASDKKAYLESKDATQAQTQATQELAKANEEAMQRAQAAAAKYGIALDDSAQSLNNVMTSNKLATGELTGKLNELEKKLTNDVQSAGKSAAQTLEELGAAAIKAAALSGASGEELDKLANQLKNIANLQKKVDQAKADEKNKAQAISSANNLAKANENYVASLEKQVATMNLSKMATLEYELSQKKLSGALLERAQASMEALRAAQQLANAKTNSSMQIEVLRLTGNDYQADLMELENKFKETTESLKKEGNTAGIALAKELFDAGKAKAQLDKIKAEIEKAFANQSRQEQSIQAQVEAGLITQYQGQKNLTELHKQTAATVEKYLPELEKAAKMPGAMGEQSKAYLTEVNNQLLALKKTTSELENAFRNGLQDGIQSSIEGLVKGTMNLQDALKNFVDSVASNMLNIVAQNMAEQATNGIMGGLNSMNALFGFGSDATEAMGDVTATAGLTATGEAATMAATSLTGLGTTATTSVTGLTGLSASSTSAATGMTAASGSATLLSSAATAAAAALQAVAASSAVSAGKGVAGAAVEAAGAVAAATGGHITGAGTGTSDSIPAMLSNGEFVTRAAVVKQPGMRAFMEDLNSRGWGAVSDLQRVKHATGGLAGTPAPNNFSAPKVPSAPNIGSMDAGAIENINNNATTVKNSQNFYIVDDPNKVGDAILNSPHAQEAIDIYLTQNNQKVRSIIQG